MTKEEQADLKKFIKDGSQEGEKISKRYDLLKYDDPSTSKEERAKIIENMKKDMEDEGILEFDHEKPELALSESEKSTEVKRNILRPVMEIINERIDKRIKHLVEEVTTAAKSLEEAKQEKSNAAESDNDELDTRI